MSSINPNKQPVWPTSIGDRIKLAFAVAIFFFAIVFGSRDLGAEADPLARANLFFLSFIAVSWLTGLCTSVDARRWVWINSAAGLLLWIVSVWFGSPGGWKSFTDMFS